MTRAVLSYNLKARAIAWKTKNNILAVCIVICRDILSGKIIIEKIREFDSNYICIITNSVSDEFTG